MSLIEQSKQVKTEATEILKQGRIFEILQKFGEVVTKGSYAADLMLSRDIDINVIGPDAGREQAIEALNDFIKDDYFGSYHLYDWFKERKDVFPEGYYIGLQKVIHDEKWKVDIWFLKKEDTRSFAIMEKLKSITPQTKELILELKNYRTEKGLKLNSYRIYEAVLEHGITNSAQLEKYAEEFNEQLTREAKSK